MKVLDDETLLSELRAASRRFAGVVGEHQVPADELLVLPHRRYYDNTAFYQSFEVWRELCRCSHDDGYYIFAPDGEAADWRRQSGALPLLYVSTSDSRSDWQEVVIPRVGGKICGFLYGTQNVVMPLSTSWYMASNLNYEIAVLMSKFPIPDLGVISMSKHEVLNCLDASARNGHDISPWRADDQWE